jgi:biotin transport system substrate-specific component
MPVPGSPVPARRQTFAVLLTAAALGPARAVTAQAVYLALGVIPPLFAGAVNGPGTALGATGVYLAGFLAAGAIVDYGSRRGADRSPVRTLLLFALTSVVIYVIGMAWLCLDSGLLVGTGISAGGMR